MSTSETRLDGCPACHGTGWQEAMHAPVRCDCCGGSGLVYAIPPNAQPEPRTPDETDVEALVDEAIEHMQLAIDDTDADGVARLHKTRLARALVALCRERDQRTALEEARTAWIFFAAHLASCVECGETSWTECEAGRELRARCQQVDPTQWFAGDARRSGA